MQIIFNADDFGLTQGINHGIVEAFRSGVVRSTTLMVGMSAERHALELVKENSGLHVGIHLRLTTGRPLTKAMTLIDEHGEFLSLADWEDKQSIDAREVYEEVVMQIEHFLQLGIPLSHIDSHHHIHMHPLIAPIVYKVAQRYRVPLRGVGVPDHLYNGIHYRFSDKFYDHAIGVEQAKQLIQEHIKDVDILEVMCHPAYIDADLIKISSYQQQREIELSTLTSPEFIRFLRLHDVRVTDYSVLTY
ncbi:chitin disaccharide deacetylase [Vibrio sinensis]|uniref:Carbohydrate deacetylase n=1 Tax=Vibrio sinensis TaxID=2302434 RepID=A0A3A6QCB9_9VIBR|nr:chitin disaccharide deacetylase [Vibrio sinensis]RJX65099.1 chitin disaccharide deacetylase [Vibrio sinensis]